MRALVVDDHPLLQEIIPALLRKAFGEVAISIASNLEDGLRHAESEQPELTLLDLGLPGCSGLDAVARFRKRFPALPVIVVSGECEPHLVVGALESGAAGFIPKTSRPDVMIAALRLVRSGGVYVPPEAARPPAGGDRLL